MRRLWITLGIVVVFEFAVLGWIGTRIYQEMPPIPTRVVTTDGQEIIGPGEIMRGQKVWQTMGGMEVGSIWRRPWQLRGAYRRVQVSVSTGHPPNV